MHRVLRRRIPLFIIAAVFAVCPRGGHTQAQPEALTYTFPTAKQSVAMTPGSVLLFDDVGAKVGHGGHIGPCGYVSLSIAPAP